MYIKEYSAGSCSVNTINGYLEDLYKQKDFKPDLVCIDYLTLMRSDRVNSSSNMYEKGKIIAEELHGMAKELGIPILTAAQLNRSSVGNLESEINSISESFGIAQTADTMVSLLTDDNLRSKGKVLAKINKNRNTGIMLSTEMLMEAQFMKYRDIENSEFVERMNQNPHGGRLTYVSQEDISSWWREGE